MNRRQAILQLAGGVAAGLVALPIANAITLPAFANPRCPRCFGPMPCMSVHDYPPRRVAQVPYSVGGAPTQDAPDLVVETWQYQDRKLIICRWPEASEQEISKIAAELFDLGYGESTPQRIWQ